MESTGKHTLSLLCVNLQKTKATENLQIGLAEMAYVPPQTPMMRQEWPTLRQMLDSGKRLVFFIDKGADEGVVPYILPEFTMVCVILNSLFPSLGLLSLLATNLFYYCYYLGVGR